MFIFVIFPVKLPSEWRKNTKGKGISHKLMQTVTKFDGESNCFPSMHVSVAMLTALHLLYNAPFLGAWVFSFPILISLSALYTKQHYFMDLIPGAILGWAVFEVYFMLGV